MFCRFKKVSLVRSYKSDNGSFYSYDYDDLVSRGCLTIRPFYQFEKISKLKLTRPRNTRKQNKQETDLY